MPTETKTKAAPRTSKAPAAPAASKALAKSEPSKPAAPAPPETFQWRRLSYLGVAVAALWLTALATGSRVFLGVIAALTVALAGLLLYMYRWARKQREMMSMLQSASVSKEAREEALAKLESSKDNKDVMNVLARAQLEAQDDPAKALETLETLDLKKVPAILSNDVKAMKAQLYLARGKTREAAELAEDIDPTSAQNVESRGLMTAVKAMAWARTGKSKEAASLLETVKPEDEEFGQARAPLLMARVWANFGLKEMEKVRKDLKALMNIDYNLLGAFAMKEAHPPPELQKMAIDLLKTHPEVQKQAQAAQNRASRRAQRR